MLDKQTDLRIDFEDIEEENRGKPTFALYTGTESAEIKEMMRLIFNGDWEKLPNSLKESLNLAAPNNNRGEIIKIFTLCGICNNLLELWPLIAENP